MDGLTGPPSGAPIAPIAHVRITPVTGGWRVLVGDGSTRPAEAIAPVGPALRAAVDARASLAAPRVRIPGSDAAFTRAEGAIADALASTLAGAGPAWAALQVLRGRAEAHGQALTVVIDAEEPEVRSLPWELVSLGAGDGPYESHTGGVVVRLAAGARGGGPAGPTVAVWLGGADPVSDALAAQVRATFEVAGLREVGLDDAPTLVWLVAHGTRGADQLEVELGDSAKDGEAGKVSAGAVSARLGSALRTARGAIVAVCHGGAAELDRRDVLVGWLLRAGIELVVAPPSAVPTDVLAVFARGLAEACGRGESLGRMVASGRRAVRAWAMPHPLARWTELTCFVSSFSALEPVLRPAGWRPPGWPTPDPGASAWLDAAFRDAVRRQDGYVGVEHLLRALGAIDGGRGVAAAVRRMAGQWLARYDAANATLSPQRVDGAAGPLDPAPTPRLRRFGDALIAPADAPFGIEDLADLVLEAFPVGIVEPGAETVDATPLPGAGGPADALEVIGGPEDGRVLVPSDGDAIGRAGGDAELTLYATSRLTDPRLSRRHLVWRDGRLDAVRAIEITSLHGPRDPTLPVRVGDLIALTPATRLRAVRRPA